MPAATRTIDYGPIAHYRPGNSPAQVMIVCEHASNRVPAALGGLGLDAVSLQSHIAWDPGALGVAEGLADQMQAPLVAACISRLVYDCNRPPEAPGAMPEVSEVTKIPGNQGLSPAARAERANAVHDAFHGTVRQHMAANAPIDLLVTVHSFTPVYHGAQRAVEIGLLHGKDDRFARAMLALTPPDLGLNTQLNEPYSAADGVAHTIDMHGSDMGRMNVMIEIRNDLIKTPAQQADMAARLAPWISATLADITKAGAA